MASLQARIGGLAVLQTVAEVAASSSLEKISSDYKVQPPSVNIGKYTEATVGLFKSPASVEKECSSTQDVDSTQSLLEATRGKVGALKQVGCFCFFNLNCWQSWILMYLLVMKKAPFVEIWTRITA